MFLLLSHINARIDPNIPTKMDPRFPAIFSIRRYCSFGPHEKKGFKMQRALKVKCHVRVQELKRQRDFNEAVGLQVALLIGSDRYGRRFCAAGRRPRGRRMFVARSLFQITSPLHERCRSKRRRNGSAGPALSWSRTRTSLLLGFCAQSLFRHRPGTSWSGRRRSQERTRPSYGCFTFSQIPRTSPSPRRKRTRNARLRSCLHSRDTCRDARGSARPSRTVMPPLRFCGTPAWCMRTS